MIYEISTILWGSIPFIFVATICIYLFLVVIPFWRRILTMRALPGPPISHWFYGNLKDMRPVSRGFQFKRKYAAQYPRLCRYVFAPWVIQLQVCHPETIKQLYLEFKSYKGNPQLFNFGEKSLFASNGSIWKDRRKMLTPAFHFEMLNLYIEPLNRTTGNMLRKWERHSEESRFFNCSPDLTTLTLDAFLQSAFSLKTSIQEKEDFPLEDYQSAQNVLNEAVDVRVKNPLYRLNFIYNLTSHSKRVRIAQNYLTKMNMQLLGERREEIRIHGSTNKKDFCTILLTTPTSDGSFLSDEEIEEEVGVFIFAGRDTTSSSLGWAIYNLGKFPELQGKCREEILRVLGGKDEVSREDIQELTYLTMFIKESLRMYPVATSVNKRSNKPLQVDGHEIPVGSLLNVGIYQAHYLEEFWPEPDEFDPNRFSPENIDKIHPFSFLPFSAGPRNCIGQKFALIQMQIFLAQLLKKFSISLDENHSYEPMFRLTIQAQNGIKIKLEAVE